VEKGALVTGMGGPGKEVCTVCKGEVGNMSRRVRNDSVGGEENGAGVGDDKGAAGVANMGEQLPRPLRLTENWRRRWA
jgi:hypothetical protein